MALSPRKKNVSKKGVVPKSPASRIPQKKNPISRQRSIKTVKTVKTVKTIKKRPVVEKKAKHVFPTETVKSVPPSQLPAPIPPAIQMELPENYGDNQIYLLIRDPYWLYSYWEIQKSHQEETLKKLGGSWDGVVSILRVFDVTEGSNHPSYFDIVIQNMCRSWYISVQPNHAYVVEIGLLHRDGRYAVLARSNTVRTPRAGMSEVIDEQWMAVDWDKMYALSGGFQVGKSSAELRELMEERLKGAISSGSGAGLVSSVSSPVKIKKRGFFFWLECELIIYGGTEPDAEVTMQGRPVSLRPDGTFTLRYALPDGKFTFDCRAKSSDGVEEREITPIIGRTTERPAPIIKKGAKK
jgi:hypothetical protein